MHNAFYFLSALAAATGLYVHLSESWTLPYRWNLILHPVLGVLMVLYLIPYLVRHLREKGVAFRKLVPFGGWLVLAVTLATFISGLVLLRGADHDLGRIYAHRYVGYGLLGLMALHLLPRTVRAVRTRSPGRFVLGTARASASTVVLASLALVIVAAIPPGRESLQVDFHALLENPPEKRLDSNALTMTASCGSAPACHESLTKEYERTAHYLAPDTTHFRRITDLLAEERGKDAQRFCTSCHAPGSALSVGEAHTSTGFGCLACHAQQEAHIAPPQSGTDYEVRPEGYTFSINTDHMNMFPSDGKSRLTQFNEYLIRLNPIGHGRVFRPPHIASDTLCLACHQEHIPSAADTQFLRPRCIDCHMKLQETLSASGSDRPHLFLGANVVLPHLRSDHEMSSKVKSWLTGYFETEVLDSFWELRTEKEQKPAKAVWLVMTMEPMAAAGAAHPGGMLPIKVYTSNVGIGHPFPTGVLDLYDIWLSLEIYSADRELVYRSGYSGGLFSREDGIHRLGGYFKDVNGIPIDRHRVWEKKETVRRVIEPGKTVEDYFEVPIPDRDWPGDHLIVTARWLYERLNRPFVSWAFGPERPDFPIVEMASVTQSVPLRSPEERPASKPR